MQTPAPPWEPNAPMSPRDLVSLSARYPRSTLWIGAGVAIVLMFCLIGAIR